MTRIVGLDHGERRIGVAVGDTETGMAFARAAIQRRSLDRDLGLVGELCAAESTNQVVVGLPLNMDGSEGEQTSAARRFGDALERIGLEVTYEDERLTSWQAGRDLKATGRNPRRTSGELDSTAARLILQQYLDAHRPTDTSPEETA